MVLNWLYAGGKTVFLQDANSFAAPTKQLLKIINHLKKRFPDVERITTYARAKTIARKSQDELNRLRKAGLSRLHVGLETGDNDLLAYVDKGITAGQQIEAGKKAKIAGFELSDYVMIDLGGRDRSEQHAVNTAKVLNEIDPDYIRLRPFAIGPKLPLYEDYENGNFKLADHNILTFRVADPPAGLTRDETLVIRTLMYTLIDTQVSFCPTGETCKNVCSDCHL
jgi:radical SAM superfamily enzyme YgiQ (UPF0313 family)